MCRYDTALINIGVPGSHPNGQLCFRDTDGNRIRLEVWWSDTLHKKHDIYASFVGIVGNLWADPGLLRSKMFCIYVKPTHISVLNFTAGVATLVQRGSGPWWSQRILSWPLSSGEGLLADSGMTSPGGPFVPPFGSVEILHTKAAWRSYLLIWVDAALLKIPNKIKP